MAADRRKLTSELSRQIAVLALALGGYFASVALGGNGFIAAFVAGLAFGAVTRHAEERAELFSETAGILLSIGGLDGLRGDVRRLAPPRHAATCGRSSTRSSA